MTMHELFTTDTVGIDQVLPTQVVRLHDGDRFDLHITPVRKNLKGADLRMLAYNGSIPGPTLHVDQGAEIIIQVTNDGDVAATVHWHGLRLENGYDGVPHETQEPIPVGGTFTYRVHWSALRPPRGAIPFTQYAARAERWRQR